MKSLRITLAATIALSASSAFAQNAPVAVRATIEGVAADGTSLNVRTRAGEERAVHLNAKTRFVLVVPAAIADVKPGAYIGVAALPGEGDELRAMEVHIFPEAMRGTGEGFRPFDLIVITFADELPSLMGLALDVGCGSRPSIAASARAGDMNARDSVIRIERSLLPSRMASDSMAWVGSTTSSSSQR